MIRNKVGSMVRNFPILEKFRNKISSKFPSYFYFPSYSQWGEDAVISQYLHSKIGSYIDIGSGHPIIGNNTFFLYQRGWTGVLVDPIRLNSELSKKHRSRDIFLQNVVSNSNTNLDFWEFSKYGISTIDENRAKLLVRQGEELIDNYKVSAIKLSDVFSSFINLGKELPELLSIDVEGAELDVLESNDWISYKPYLVCIEILNNDLFGEVIKNNPVFLFLTSKGYVLRASVGNSLIFLNVN